MLLVSGVGSTSMTQPLYPGNKPLLSWFGAFPLLATMCSEDGLYLPSYSSYGQKLLQVLTVIVFMKMLILWFDRTVLLVTQRNNHSEVTTIKHQTTKTGCFSRPRLGRLFQQTRSSQWTIPEEGLSCVASARTKVPEPHSNTGNEQAKGQHRSAS